MLMGVYQPNSPGSYGQIDTFAQAAGVRPHFTSYYTSSFGMPFASSFAQQAASRGTTVLLQWQPRGTTNAAVANGSQDAAIKACALAVKALNYQVIISYGQEMNGNWYPWGAGSDKATNFINAWRRIHSIFTQNGAYNVTWMWGPNVSYSGSAPLKSWYPGDDVVDWVGLDGYFATPSDTFSSLFLPSIEQVRAFTGKPLIVGETGVTAADGPARLWDLFTSAAMAGMIGVLYFDEAQSGDPEHQDWRLENNPTLMSAYKEIAQLYAQRPLTGV